MRRDPELERAIAEGLASALPGVSLGMLEILGAEVVQRAARRLRAGSLEVEYRIQLPPTAEVPDVRASDLGSMAASVRDAIADTPIGQLVDNVIALMPRMIEAEPTTTMALEPAKMGHRGDDDQRAPSSFAIAFLVLLATNGVCLVVSATFFFKWRRNMSQRQCRISADLT